jgi:hypothetical protein
MTLKKNLVAFAVISLLGTLGHFLYKWTGENYFVGLLFPVNESTFEHLKLLFFPAIIYFTFEYFFLKEKPSNFICASVISVIWGMISIITLFYTYKGVLGYSVDTVNIAIYYVSVILTLCKRNKLIQEEKFCLNAINKFFMVVAFVITLLFIFWSYNPPSLGIFIPPPNAA